MHTFFWMSLGFGYILYAYIYAFSSGVGSGHDPLIITAAAKCGKALLDRFCTRRNTAHVVTLHAWKHLRK